MHKAVWSSFTASHYQGLGTSLFSRLVPALQGEIDKTIHVLADTLFNYVLAICWFVLGTQHVVTLFSQRNDGMESTSYCFAL